MSDIISDGGMDPRYEYEKARRTDKDKRIAELQAELEKSLTDCQDCMAKQDQRIAELEAALAQSCDEERARCRQEGGYPCELEAENEELKQALEASKFSSS